LLKVLERELDLIRLQNEFRDQLDADDKYSPEATYEAIDRCNAGFINVDNLCNFLTKDN
jgi:hypothetical protein